MVKETQNSTIRRYLFTAIRLEYILKDYINSYWTPWERRGMLMYDHKRQYTKQGRMAGSDQVSNLNNTSDYSSVK